MHAAWTFGDMSGGHQVLESQPERRDTRRGTEGTWRPEAIPAWLLLSFSHREELGSILAVGAIRYALKPFLWLLRAALSTATYVLGRLLLCVRESHPHLFCRLSSSTLCDIVPSISSDTMPYV